MLPDTVDSFTFMQIIFRFEVIMCKKTKTQFQTTVFHVDLDYMPRFEILVNWN